jgi:hypothetical protein
MPTGDFARAIALIDAANGADAVRIVVRGEARPKELVHAAMLSDWVRRLRPEPPEALLLAARAHHIRRWERPRGDYPDGRGGYLRWRIDAERFHADVAGVLLREAGYGDDTVERVAALITKKGLGAYADDDLQALEDGLCLVFLETQLAEVAGRIDHERMLEILRKTWKKMSPAAQQHALTLAAAFAPEEQALLRAALG